ncbi:efflux RND transporter periplasmic adaptor subunit [Orrella sp. NBD-18]|uniref:Efflux RND transporter periplasmic adaptor subunit n=1 Tax=Sheuella amnicola TaxID=2707330 RepID=A0A6B2QZ14_9BURK|nr:efflux RND transporter periplasmic adaptor subunit [Sheuella amnicola]NDY83740.1 efflux RND transporter periplasmic adaptor subunit [Sheuella amnicola]
MFSSVRKVADSGGNVLLRSFFSVFGVASVLLSGLLLVSPSRAQGNAGKPPALPVSVIEVSSVTLPNILEVTAQAEGAKETEVRSRVGGILIKRLYEEGAWVKEGQPLFQIDPEPFKITLEEAQAKAKQTAREAARLKMLFAQQAVSRKEYDDATTANEIAQANLKTARLNLKWSTVTAPMSGVSGRAQRSEGNLITTTSDGSLLTSIYEINPIWVRFGLSSSETARLPGGRLNPEQTSQVEIYLPNGKLYPYPGKLNFLSTFIDQKLGTQQFRAEFPNPDQQILPGQFLKVRLTTGKQENVYLVPQAAVIQSERGFMVWKLDADNKVVPAPLQMGMWHGKNWIVLSGLKAGDRVVIDNIIKIRPGTTVTPTVVPLEPAAKGSDQQKNGKEG